VEKPTELSELEQEHQEQSGKLRLTAITAQKSTYRQFQLQSALCHTRHLTVRLLAMELITRNSIAKQLQADPRLKAFDDLPVEAILINGSKRIPLYKASIVYELIRNLELTTKERN
jgi:hypothetical protein